MECLVSSSAAPLWVFLGGIGLFLFGIRHFSESLQKTAGPRFKRIIERLTANRFLSLLSGALLTLLFQSETVAAILAVTLVNSGFLSLYQTIALLFGTTFGTLLGAGNFTFRSHEISMLLVFVGVMAKFFLRSRRIADWGGLVFGAGMTFIALGFIEQGVSAIVKTSLFGSLLSRISTVPLVPVVLGSFFSVVLQSSQSAITMTLDLLSSRIIGIEEAHLIATGAFLGGPSMAVVAALAGTSSARRGSAVHFLCTVLFVSLFAISAPFALPHLLRRFPDPASGIAVIRMALASILALSMILFVGVVTRALSRKEESLEPDLKYLDFRIVSTPSLAIHQLRNELSRMTRIACGMIVDMETLLHRFDNRVANRIVSHERTLDHLQHEISRFATALVPLLGDAEERERMPMVFAATNNLEQIGDKVVRFLQVLVRKKDERIHFSHSAMNDLKSIVSRLRSFVERVAEAGLRERIPDPEQKKFHEEIFIMIQHANESHLQRLVDGVCRVRGGMLYSEMLELLSRLNDDVAELAHAHFFEGGEE